MKLRQKPEDFIVEELNSFDLVRESKFKLYSLKKTGIETFYLLSHISKKNNIPSKAFGVAGLKDKHAISTQYFTIPSKYDISEKNRAEKNFEIKFLGYVEKELRPGNLEGNRFTITVRDIKEESIAKIRERAKNIELNGTPNYFDSQRFGSVINGEFIYKYVLEANYEKAVKLYLTLFTKFEKKNVRDEKKLISRNWKDLEKIKDKIKTKTLSKVIDEYAKTNDWKKAYSKIPEHMQDMQKKAYESFQWNEKLKDIIKKNIRHKNLYSVKYNAGSLLFYSIIDEKVLERIRKEKIDDPKLDRPLIVFPKQFELSDDEKDELNKGRYRLTLKFTLSKGSYATIVTKRVFNQ